MKISVILEALTGSFETDIKRANKVSEKAFKQMQKDAKAAREAMTKNILIAGAAVGTAFYAIQKATAESEAAIAQLESALKSTGGAVGFTSSQLQGFAQELQKTSTLGDEAIIGLQTRLLSFGNVTGDVFKRATQATIDLSARLGKDLNSAALQVGKALNDPVKGLAGLSRAGIQFSAEQKEVIKTLAETGEVAGAQAIILTELERKFGGAAQAARNTFGGALTSLREAMGDLLEAPGGMADATKSLNEFTALLQDPATKQAAETLTSSLVTGFSLVTEAMVGSFNALNSFGEKLRSQSWFTEAVDYMAEQAGQIKRNYELLLTGSVTIGEGTIDRSRAAAPAESPAPASPNAEAPKPSAGASRKSTRTSLTERPKAPATKSLWEADYLFDQADQAMSEIEDRAREHQSILAGIDRLRLDSMDAESRALAELQANYIELQNAIKAGAITQEEAAKISAGLAERWAEDTKQTTTELSEFAKAAAQNMQTAFADFLFDPFSDGLDGMLLDFVNVLRRMAAEAIAAQIFDSIGKMGQASGGPIGAFFAAFAGAKDAGGSIPAGSWALVGERRPELVAGPATVMGGAQTGAMLQQSQKAQANVKIVNAIDPRFIADYLAGPDGDEVFVNLASRNARKMRSITAGA